MPGVTQPAGDEGHDLGGVLSDPLRIQAGVDDQLLPRGVADTSRVAGAGVELGEAVGHDAADDPVRVLSPLRLLVADDVEQRRGVEGPDEGGHAPAGGQVAGGPAAHGLLTGQGEGVGAPGPAAGGPAVGQGGGAHLPGGGSGGVGLHEPVPDLLGVLTARPGPPGQGLPEGAPRLPRPGALLVLLLEAAGILGVCRPHGQVNAVHLDTVVAGPAQGDQLG